jgi:outer membrane receptor for ferrienterochelin and colicin
VVGYDYYRHSTSDTTDIFNAYSFDFAINQVFAKADFTYYLNNSHTLNVGVNTMQYRMNPGNIKPALPSSLLREDRLQTEKALESALYISDQWEISPEWMVSAGIRYAMFNVLAPRTYNVYQPDKFPSKETVSRTDTVGRGVLKTYHGPEFRFSVRYIINENTSLKAGVNSMRQYIHKISNSTAMSPTDTWKLSDMNIVPQSGVQYVVGLFRNFAGNTIETSLETYYKTMRNYLDYRVGAELMMNPNLEMEAAGVRGKAYGVELMLKKTQGNLNGWVSYAYSRTLLHKHEELSSAENAAEWYPADFDKPHEVKFVGNYKITTRYSVSLNADYSTGRPITLPVSKYWIDSRQYVFYSERNKLRVPDFFRMDASFNIEAGHRLTKATHGYFNIGVYNVTGRKNAYSVYYISEGNKIQGYRLSIFGVPIPYISYNMKF